MSIQFPTIITADDYREFQTGKNSPVNDNDINSAINTTFIQLNGICNNQIMLRWNLTEGSDMLNATQKNLIQQAFLLQTKYNLDYDNDTSEGTVQSSFGANNYSSTRPRRDKVTQDVLNLLNKAGVYQQFQATSVNRSRYGMIGSPRRIPSFDDYVTYEIGDARYLLKFQGQQLKGKFLYVDDNGIIAFKKAPFDKVDWGDITGQLENQIDLYAQLTYLDDFCEALDSTKAPADSVYTKLQVDELIATSSAEFLGSYVGGETRPTTFDYDTFIREHLPTGTVVTANDYVFVIWSDENEYDRCKYNATTNTWIFEFTFRGGNVIPYITIESPSTATSGTLTSEQLLLLQSSNNSYILFNNEKYYLNDLQHTYGSLGYTHTGYENGAYIIKNITITISTLGWVLNSWNSMNSLWPVNSIWTTINASDDPNTIWPGTTWQLISTQSYIPNLPNVFGNGKTLGLTNGTQYGSFGEYSATTSHTTIATGLYNQNVGETIVYGTDFPAGPCIGIPTKAQVGTNYSNTGIELDTTQVYMWKRTA